MIGYDANRLWSTEPASGRGLKRNAQSPVRPFGFSFDWAPSPIISLMRHSLDAFSPPDTAKRNRAYRDLPPLGDGHRPPPRRGARSLEVIFIWELVSSSRFCPRTCPPNLLSLLKLKLRKKDRVSQTFLSLEVG